MDKRLLCLEQNYKGELYLYFNYRFIFLLYVYSILFYERIDEIYNI